MKFVIVVFFTAMSTFLLAQDNSALHYEELQKTYSEIPGYVLENKKVKIPLAWILDHVLNLKGFLL